MTSESAFTLLNSFAGVGVTIMLAAIPWAYRVHGRLTQIETMLTSHLRSVQQVTELERRMTRIEIERSVDAS
jgi:hypothetical protein